MDEFNDFKKEFDSEVHCRIKKDSIEVSLKDFLIEKISEGKFINYIEEHNLPFDVSLYASVGELVDVGVEKKADSKFNFMSRVSRGKLFSSFKKGVIAYVDDYVSDFKLYEDELSFHDFYTNLKNRYSTKGVLQESAQNFVNKYDSCVKLTKKDASTEDIIDSYKSKASSVLKQFLNGFIDDVFS
ncbi:hypothetical protein K9L97_00595 [Candidatus Woesearchaeota archaeon]|nr:hypothetical protein [Candidatus Woesearchaeota archaeon]